jgi:hypothetical protein
MGKFWAEVRSAALPLVAFAIGEGNQLSGRTIPWLSEALFIFAGVMALIWAWPHARRLYGTYNFRWPVTRVAVEVPLSVRAEANRERPRQGIALAEQSPLPATKYYSKSDKERLSDLYAELAQFFLSNSADAGAGFGAKLFDLMQSWSRHTQGHSQANIDDLVAKQQEAGDASVVFYKALYGPDGITQKNDYLAYGSELQAALQDENNKAQLTLMQHHINAIGRAILAMQRAYQYNDLRLISDMDRASIELATNYINHSYAFKGWEQQVAKRAQEARQKLTV